MKPIGTITIHYPHVDEETREILQSVVPEAENFADFTERLCVKVCTENTPMLTQYLVFYFAFLLRDNGLVDRLEEADRISVMSEPLLLLTRDRRGQGSTWEDMKESLERALDSTPNDWFVCHVYLTWRLGAGAITSFTQSDYGLHPFQSIISVIEENENLEYFKRYLLAIEAGGFTKDLEYSKSYELHEQVLQIAKKFDDRMIIANTISNMGYLAKYSDIKKGSDLLVRARTLFEEIGYTLGIASSQGQMGTIMAFRGELNAAIEYTKDFAMVRESLSQPSDLQMCVVAFFNNHAGYSDEALRILNDIDVSDRSPTQVRVCYHFQRTWALVNLHRHDEVEVEFERARSAATRMGTLLSLIQIDVLEGIMEKAMGESGGAVEAFTRAYESLDKKPAPIYYKNLCLLNLTDIEIETYDSDTLDSNEEVSGPWMQRLEEHIKRNDVPGIAAWSKILKAKFRQKQGRDGEISELLNEVLNISKSSSMRYLREIVLTTFPGFPDAFE